MINYQELYKILNACYIIAPINDVRYYLNGIHIIADEYGTTIEATDGSRLVQFKTTSLIQGAGNGFDVILDRKHVKLFIDKIKAMNYHKTDLHEVILLDCNEDRILFNTGDINLINGRYPKCERVIWRDAPKAIEGIGIDASFLADIPKITKPFITKKVQPVKMEFKSTSDSVRVTFDTGIDELRAIMIIMPCRL